MSGKKIMVMIILILVIFSVVAAGMAWHMQHYQMVDFRFYPRDAVSLDLREESISIKHYDKLTRYKPECKILWNVPFQDSAFPNDSTELTVSSLTDQDVDTLSYFPQLKTLHAEKCTDYDKLLEISDRYPELELYFNIELNGQKYPQDAKQIKLTAITQEELALLPCFRNLETVLMGGGEDIRNVLHLRDYCRKTNVDFCVVLGEAILTEDATQIRPVGVTDGELNLLQFLPHLKQVHLVKPEASAEKVKALRDSRIDLTVTWEQELCGQLCASTDAEIDLSEATIPSLEAVEQGMAYFPDAEKLFLGECGIDNETLAAYRDRSRQDYKVVWVVDLSGKMKVRTDIDNFMPSRDGWGYVREGEVDNIRYCEDLICIDLGHMGLKTVDFLEPLANLEYLILAHTEVRYIDAVSNCKKLKYLELDWSPIQDLTPLLECKQLEDLNIGMAWPDITPVLQMTWLKNLYMIKGSGAAAWQASQALPNTRVVASGDYTVASGWRRLPNYYKMRDILGMHYMN